VESVTFDNDTFQARVTMQLEQQYNFPADTEAQILTAGLLGEQYIGLEAGADEENLEGGSRIRRTQSAMVLEQMISKFMYSFVENADKE
jgi:phospholipid/cholesterol/gamma-HCH transport system substrate-binding protein